MIRIGIVAGEASGDLLGAGLIRAIKARFPDAVIEGIAGPAMIAQGATALYPLERLSVMGIVEVLGRFRELHAMRASLLRHFLENPPDVFVGIDAPDFTLGLERKLKDAGIPTVHYVSPSVWAWRQWRIRKIARSTDLMLTLLPFEARFYEEHHVPVRFVGHPLAEMIPPLADPQAARAALGLPSRGEIVALLPGSRMSEINFLAAIFIQAAVWCVRQRPGLQFVIPLATPATRERFTEILNSVAPDLPVTVFEGRSREVMAAADVVLLASGTATLEAMLLKRPMVMAYRLAPLTYWLAKRLVKIPYFSLPNLLAAKPLVPEFIQDAATPENLGHAILDYLIHPASAVALQETFAGIHASLRQGADQQAADAVLSLISPNKRKEAM
ncbi:MAG: lipid-A-disaccharide synthase [Gammaproteobacteria bacterium]